MKTKREIIESLCDNGAIDFKEALILLDFEVNIQKRIHKVFPTYKNTTHIPPVNGDIIYESNSDLENK
jgi:hypothetical protein